MLEKCNDDVESVEITPDGKWKPVNQNNVINVDPVPKKEKGADVASIGDDDPSLDAALIDFSDDDIPLSAFQTNTISFATKNPGTMI